MAFFKPDIKWTSKDIKGDVNIVADKSKKVAPDSKDAAVRDTYTDEQKKLIDEYIDLYSDINDDLNSINEELDDGLKDIAVPYDAKKFPLFRAAQVCPYCGKKDTTSIITYDDIKRKQDAESRFNTAMSNNIVPTDFGNMSTSDIASHQEKAFNNMQTDMLKEVVNQILIWVLEMLLVILTPLKYVPGARAIPNQIENWIEELRGKKTKDEEQLKKEAFADYDKKFSGLKPLNSIGGIHRECVNHISNFNNQLDTVIDDTKTNTRLKMQKTNNVIKDQVKATNEISGVAIKDGYISGSGKTYNSDNSEPYLKNKGVDPALILGGDKGTVAILKETKDYWIKEAKKTLIDFIWSTETLCCILNNILKIGQIGLNLTGGKELLLGMRSVLMMWRNYLTFDLNIEVTNLVNLIVDLINTVLGTLLRALAVALQGQMNFLSLDALKRDEETDCLPWNALVDTISDALKYLLGEFHALFLGFFEKIHLSNIKAKKAAQLSAKVLFLDKCINLIDSVIKFMKVYKYCLDLQEGEGKKDAKQFIRTRLHYEDRSEIVDGENVQYSPKSTTIYKGGKVDTYNDIKKETQISDDIVLDLMDNISTQDTAKIDTKSMKILLTNYVGLSETQANDVLEKEGDCACDKSLTDAELEVIKDALIKRDKYV